MHQKAEPDTLVTLLKTLSLTTMASELEVTENRALEENWSHRQYLHELCAIETSVRHQRKLERLLKSSALPEGKSLVTLDQKRFPLKLRTHLATLLDGNFAQRHENVLAFGLPGRGKTHFLCALGRELILRHGISVRFIPTFKLVQQLLAAKRDLELEKQLARLDRYEVIILDDIGYVQQSREEMEVLFTFFAERYERKSLMITSNLVFSQWERIFHDPMTTMAAIDRLVHHSHILEFSGASQRATDAASGTRAKTVKKTGNTPKRGERKSNPKEKQ